MYLTCNNPNVSKVFQESLNETAVLYPRARAVDSKNNVDVYLELPGVTKADIEVNVSNHVLTVSAKKQGPAKEPDSEYFNEISYGEYKRKLKLADNLDTSTIEAKYSDGVLRLSIPKKPESQPKTISVS